MKQKIWITIAMIMSLSMGLVPFVNGASAPSIVARDGIITVSGNIDTTGDLVTLTVLSEDGSSVLYLNMPKVTGKSFSQSFPVPEGSIGKNLNFVLTGGGLSAAPISVPITSEAAEATPTPAPTAKKSSSSGGGGGGGGSFTVSPPAESAVPEASASPVSTAVTDGIVLNDLDVVPWASEAILHLAKNGVVSGYEDGTFRPDDYITRSQFTKMLVLALQKLDEAAEITFQDVSPSDWYYKYVASGVKYKISMGQGGGYFGAEDYITREDMTVMALRAVSASGTKSGVSYTDSSKISDYAKEYVAIATGMGLVNGVGDNLFDPQGYVTRAMAAKVVYGLERE